MKKYSIGDIVHVLHYNYKSGLKGDRHNFIIVDDGQAIDLDYYAFLMSSHLEKESYPYNERINRDDTNNLRKNSIVKCDDLISISENDIVFKIGQVQEEDLDRFINTYSKYLEETMGASV